MCLFFRSGNRYSRSLGVLLLLCLLGTGSLWAQKSDTIGNGKTASSSDGPIIRGSNTAAQYSYSVYMFTEEELIAKGIYPGAIIHKLSWQRGNSGAYVPTLISGATADWTISVKDGNTATKYVSGTNVYNYISSGFTRFGAVHFDDASNNLPSLQEQWMDVSSGSGYIYKGGSLEVFSDWAITSVPGAGNPTSIGAISWYYTSVVPSTEPKTMRASNSTAITGPATVNFLTSASRPNIVLTYTPAPDCSGTPVKNIIADSSVYCPGRTFVRLQLPDFKAAPGLTIKWQSSIANANSFADIPNATSKYCFDTIIASRDYRAVITCTGSGLSSTTALVNIAISAPASTPVTELFSSATIPSCWSMSSSNTNAAGAWLFSGSPTAGASPANNGRTAATFAWTDNTYKAADKTLYMPFVDLSNLNNPVLQFELFSNYAETGKEGTFSVEVFDNGNWTNIFSNKGSKATWRSYTVPLTAYAKKQIQIRFIVDESATTTLTNDILLDAVEIKEAAKCPSPSDIVATAPAPNAVTLNWTENGNATQWQIAYDTGVINPATAPKVIAGARPFLLNNLKQASDYQVLVRAICGSGDTSAWSVITDLFSTTCPVSFSIPYTQDFIKWPAPCWETKTGVLGSSLIVPATSNWRQANWMHTGTTNKAAEINLFGANKYEWLISPSLDLGTGSVKYQLDFNLAFLNSSTTPTPVGAADDTFAVVISTDNGQTWQRNNILAYWTMNNTPFENGYKHIVLDLDKYSGIVKIGFYAGSVVAGGNSNILVDNVLVSPMPSCRVPVNTQTDRITHKSARIHWEEPGKPKEWQIEYGPAGFKPGTGKTVTAATMPFVLGDLDHSTQYDFYVRSVCGTEKSEPSTVNTFRTLCVTNVPYAENFDASATFPACMSREQLVKNGSDWQVSTTSSNALSIPNYLKYDVVYDASPANPASNWFYTPGLSLGADTSYTITFAYRTQYPQGYKDKFNIYMGSVAMADSMLVAKPLYSGISDTNMWRVDVVKVTPAKSGIYYIGFQCVSDSGYSLFFDDISVVKTFVCYPPTGLTATNVTATGADMGWTENNSATQWALEYGAKGFTPGSGTKVFTKNNPYKLPVGLDDSTQYDFYVRAICSAGDTSRWSSVQTFATRCIYPEVSLGNDTSVCTPYIVESATLGLDHLWNTGETTPGIIVKTSGEYWVKVSKKNGCSSTDTIKLDLRTPPVIDSVTVEMTARDQAVFTPYTTGDVDGYSWDFGDGQTSTEQFPTHDYNMVDTYMVTLTVKNDCGTTSKDTFVIVEKEKDPDPEPGDNIADIQQIKKLIRVYPNPADHFVTVDNLNRLRILSLSILNVTGAVLWDKKDIYREKYTIPTTDLAPGIYWLRVVTETGTVTYKLELLH